MGHQPRSQLWWHETLCRILGRDHVGGAACRWSRYGFRWLMAQCRSYDQESLEESDIPATNVVNRSGVWRIGSFGGIGRKQKERKVARARRGIDCAPAALARSRPSLFAGTFKSVAHLPHSHEWHNPICGTTHRQSTSDQRHAPRTVASHCVICVASAARPSCSGPVP